jgi:hypothetical protein
VTQHRHPRIIAARYRVEEVLYAGALGPVLFPASGGIRGVVDRPQYRQIRNRFELFSRGCPEISPHMSDLPPFSRFHAHFIPFHATRDAYAGYHEILVIAICTRYIKAYQASFWKPSFPADSRTVSGQPADSSQGGVKLASYAIYIMHYIIF